MHLVLGIKNKELICGDIDRYEDNLLLEAC